MVAGLAQVVPGACGGHGGQQRAIADRLGGQHAEQVEVGGFLVLEEPDFVPRLIRREAGVMVTEASPRADSQVARSYHHRAFGLLKDLERPGDVFRDIGPNWFASVMGTGIVAIAADTLPFRAPGLHVFAQVVWVLAASWLVLLGAAWAVHWTRHQDRARAHAQNPVMAQFWGAPAMALLTVGAGTLLVGRDWTGAAAAVGDVGPDSRTVAVPRLHLRPQPGLQRLRTVLRPDWRFLDEYRLLP